MDPRFTGFSDSIDDLKFDEEFLLPTSNQYPYNTMNGSKIENLSLNLDSMEPALEFPPDLCPSAFISSISWSPEAEPFALSSSLSPEADSPPLSNDSDSDPILKFISQMLMEETEDENPFFVQGSLPLQATQMSLNDVHGGNHHPSTNPHSLDANYETLSSDDIFSGSASSTDHQWLSYLQDYHSSPLQTPPGDQILHSSPQSSVDLPNSLVDSSSINEFLVQNIFSEKESILQFQRGLEEARKFLPGGNQFIIAPKSNTFSSPSNWEVKNESKGRKNHEREDLDLPEGGRSNKQPAVYTDEGELSEMFDHVLLLRTKGDKPPCYAASEANKNLKATGKLQGSKGGKSRAKKQGKKAEVVDLMTLLMLCAQSVSSNDRRTANELLKQIRQHSSLSGDGPQRLAHYFGNGLEARLAGTGTAAQSFHNSLASKRISVVDVLKAYHLHLSTCPFKKFAISFANRTILNLVEKATAVTTIHVVDFGIGYGFQWPSLIQLLSDQTGGPPKLRITGIDLPQPGFRPTEGIEVAGHRLARYCERFKVPFEYKAIASQNWETIQLEELKIDKKDTLVVNCLFRSQNLFDETVEMNSPRDAFLSLIKKMNPDVFIHTIITGSYNSPFFITRFREALFHHSAMFDVFETTISREDEGRLLIERDMYGREAMNVISCEGSERIERPETYKQWQVRTMNAGFRQLGLDQNIMKKLRAKLKLYGYHKDFVLDEGSNWMLQGWKGRNIIASSCWAPI